MAKNRNASNESEKKGGVFVFAGVFLAVSVLIFMFVLYNSFTRTTRIYNETLDSIESISDINNRLLTINRDLLMIISDVTDKKIDLIADINRGFTSIDKDIEDYKNASDHSDIENARFYQAQLFMNQYRNQISDIGQKILANESAALKVDVNSDDFRATYIQEIHPVQVTASEMIGATIDIAQLDTADKIQRAKFTFQMVEVVLLAVAVVGEIVIIITARISKRNREALARQVEEIEAATAKFKHTKEKASEMAYTNILTGMKNRYALDNDISGRLETEQFNIAVFDMDNFRSINDMYGYDFGDEYLAMIAERLKEEYGNDAEIYNITGNEFCFVFNKEVSDIQATRIAERVIQTLAEWYTVLNLNVQLTASGSTCHYLPGDCISVSALLVKLDNVLRDAKRNGGNMVLQVVGI